MRYKVISLMSGTSLDGVDIAHCEYWYEKVWRFNLLECETVPYSPEWENRLRTAYLYSAADFVLLNVQYGELLGQMVKSFCEKHSIAADFVSSHGHTIFHQPGNGVTVQVGSGAAIAAQSELPVVCDFRTLDVALKGQGAPLVPIGDRLLFSEYDYCLNLGGIANISFEENGERKAYDVCACNMVLNQYASKKGLNYDNDGALASAGKVNSVLLHSLSRLDYYAAPFPKSLGREDIEKYVFPLIDKFDLSVEDVLTTFSRHIAEVLSRSVDRENGKMLITGGGAFNTHLISQIKNLVKINSIVPEKNTVNYKEAVIFGFLGVLRMEKKINCLKSVTGASNDNSGGAIYHFNKEV